MQSRKEIFDKQFDTLYNDSEVFVDRVISARYIYCNEGNMSDDAIEELHNLCQSMLDQIMLIEDTLDIQRRREEKGREDNGVR